MHFYIQKEPHSLRRYVVDSQQGLRWDRKQQAWVEECAPRSTCETTHDALVSEDQARAEFPEAFA